jgi:cytochrome c5
MHVLNGFQTPGSAMAMPSMGGNPSLSEADVAKLADYMKSTFKP